MQQQKVREDEFQAAGQKLENEKQKYQQYIAEQEKELEIKNRRYSSTLRKCIRNWKIRNRDYSRIFQS